MRAEGQAHIDRIEAAMALVRKFLDWDRALRRLDELNARVEDPKLWDNPKEAEAVTEITYEPWHWRYVGPENAALISQSGLCFEDAIAVLQKLAAGQSVTG